MLPLKKKKRLITTVLLLALAISITATSARVFYELDPSLIKCNPVLVNQLEDQMLGK